ncbi:Fur family transcriptional regulator [Halomonas sp. THAF12]|uniref:Fur family transcriptional regulator n=1 Tax=Halomonas sp. B23F22_10 TaxID=3459515 RepID=UPI00373E2966
MTLARKEQLVLETLKGSKAPLGAYALLERLRGDEFSAPTQIYRSLEKLQARGLVHRLETLNAYTPCTRSGSCRGTAAFVICDDCGAIDELIDTKLLRDLAHMANRHDFSLRSSTIELHGICARCSPPC